MCGYQGLGIIAIGFTLGCGQVSATPKDAPGGSQTDSHLVDSQGQIDTPAVSIDAPTGPTPVLYWSMDNNVNNTGALVGYALTTPAGISYATGKSGQAASYASGQYAYVDGMHASLTTYAKVTIGFWMKEPGNVSSASFFDCNNRTTAPYGGMQLGLTSTSVSACVSTTTNSFLSGACNGFTAPSANTFHHWIIRYDGAGTGAGQGAATDIYIDDVLVHTRANDANNNPVWNPGAPDRLYLGVPGALLDEVKIYNQVFSVADQCTYVVRGTWTGSSCTLP